MKAEVKEKDKMKGFPKLMVFNNIIILATDYSGGSYMGMVVSSDDDYNIGFTQDDWTDKFRDFNGTVTLSND